MQAVNANGVPVLVANQPRGVLQNNRLPFINIGNCVARGLIVLGSLQMVLGLIAMGCNAVGLSKWHYASNDVSSATYIGHGFWMGIVFLITGPFGIVGGTRKVRWSLTAFNVLSITSASLAGLMLIISASAAGVGFENDRRRYNKINDRNSLDSRQSYDSELQRTLAILETMMALVAVLEAISAICSSIICCVIGACCDDCGSNGGCCQPDSNSTVVMMAGQDRRPPLQQFPMLDMVNRSGMAIPSNQQQSYYSTYAQLDYQYQELIGIPSSNDGYERSTVPAANYLELIN